jgi:hypothetical protein
LPAGYIETKETYTTAQVDAYLNGEFVNINVQRLPHTIVRHTAPMQRI